MLKPESFSRGILATGSSPLTCLAALAALLAAAFRLSGAPEPASRVTFPLERQHGVLSRAHLSPPLRGSAHHIRFSGDGNFLVVQVESGVYILSREPLTVLTWIHAPDILRARVSTDSRTLVLATRDLALTRWSLADNREIDEKNAIVHDGCLTSELSPNGELGACLDPGLMLRVYRTDTGEQILGERHNSAVPLVGINPRSDGTAYAEPFGYGIAYTLGQLSDRNLFGSRFIFSPDNHYLLLQDHGSTTCIDLMERRKFGCPGVIEKHGNAPVCFISSSEIATFDRHDPDKSEISTFPGGRLVGALHVSADAATDATQSKYLILRSKEQTSVVRLFDKDAGSVVRQELGDQADVFADTLVTYLPGGELKLLRLCNDELQAETVLPARVLPTLRTAIVSPGLEAIALGIGGNAGLFRVASGTRVLPLPRLGGAWFADDNQAYVAVWPEDESSMIVQRMDMKSGISTEVWSPTLKFDPQFTILDTHSGGPVLLVNDQSSFYISPQGGFQYPGHKRSSELAALDMKTGRKLWSKRWEGDPPVPYADPQGDRVVLGWRPTMSGGQALAKRYPSLKRQIDASKLSINDAVFEVLDVFSGKAVGTALVRAGFGPESFDSVFSVGDFLICVRDTARITLYSLSKGEICARVFGQYASASAHLLAAADGKHLKLYDLRTGATKDEYLFSEAPVYTHFSGDGKRLLVLTADQSIFVMDAATLPNSDVSQVRSLQKTKGSPGRKRPVLAVYEKCG